ncbi:MAG TPA: CusA/CzcA family heavy metal efflux RND transporter [Deltaproteobacteria bacterium]|nr:CusA/CzcA family heavy metal efflux RND transporter [Deltaproteobacteria bacterium]
MIEKIIEFSAKNKYLVLAFISILVGIAIWCTKNMPLDALPDLSDTQVIIYSKWDRSPDVIEDQVTYPIITALLGAPKVRAIRGQSDFGFSYVYVIFEDGTDIYWARSRTLEYLSKITPNLPAGVKTEMGSDATGLGWVFQYALRDKSGKNNLQELRSLQDWNLRFQLQSVPGVAEVASVGGFVKQYQVNIDPQNLLSFNIPLTHVMDAIRKSNNDVGGRIVEWSGREYMVRGRGYLKSPEDIENIVVRHDPKNQAHVLIKHLAHVEIGPDIRRGVAELNGEGESVGGIVIMRSGENALKIITQIKARLKELKSSLPEGVEIITVYDRSDLIKRAIDTLKNTLIDEMIIVSLVILVFLWHIPSALVPIFTIPISVFLAFIPMYLMGLTSNIMSLAGIAISIGVLVDGAIVEVENAYKRLEEWQTSGRKGDFHEIRLKALKEVGPSVFFSLLVIAVAFIPVFSLVDQQGRLFKPLAFSKNLAMALAAFLAITLDPAMRMLFTRMDPLKLKNKIINKLANATLVGTYYPEEKHPVSRLLFKIYEPACRYVLYHKKKTLVGAFLLFLTVIPVFMNLGFEFMPHLNEGTLLYMPISIPGISTTEAAKSLAIQDQILKSIPEVESVFGKVGRADTATDSAPFSMVETTVVLKPEDQWRKKDRWYSFLPTGMQTFYRWLWPDYISWKELTAEMTQKMQMVGWTNASFVMPIQNRVTMISTGIRSQLGIKISGPDLKTIESIGQKIKPLLESVQGTQSVFAEPVTQGYFLDFDINRTELARYGLTMEDAQTIITSAIGGEAITTTIEGRERYTVNLRYARELRDDLDEIKRVLVPTPSGAQIPIGFIANIHKTLGPSMIRNENGMLVGYIFISLKNRDPGTYINDAQKILQSQLEIPAGYTFRWSGEYESTIRSVERLKIIIPLTLILIFVLLYFNTRSVIDTCIVLLAVPFSAIGALWLVWWLGYDMSTAVYVGLIALMGLDAETGVFMLLFLDLSYKDAKEKGMLKSREDLYEAIMHGAVKRVRPKMMTVMAAMMGLLPIMFSHGTGADVMKRIAAPMIGGLVTSFILELLIYPVLYALWKEREFSKKHSPNLG